MLLVVKRPATADKFYLTTNEAEHRSVLFQILCDAWEGYISKREGSSITENWMKRNVPLETREWVSRRMML